MALGAVGNPFFGFSFAGGAVEGEIGRPAQFKRLLKFLSGTTKVFLVEIDFCEKPVKGREIVYPETDVVDLLKRFIQHFQPQAELCIKERKHPILGVVPEGPLIDTEEGARIFTAEIKFFQTKNEDDGFKPGETLSPDIPGGGPSSHLKVDISEQYKPGLEGLPLSDNLFGFLQSILQISLPPTAQEISGALIF